MSAAWRNWRERKAARRHAVQLAQAGARAGSAAVANGSPLKGAILLQKIHGLGIQPSHSRINDNAFSEILAHTAKYGPDSPTRAFESLKMARAWTACFVACYNDERRHSVVRYATPNERRENRDTDLLARHPAIYQQARADHPPCWTGRNRNWEPPGSVWLNPQQGYQQQVFCAEAA